MDQQEPTPTTNLLSSEPDPVSYIPPPIKSIEDTGLSALWLYDLALKVLYFRGYLTGFKVAEALALPFGGIGDPAVELDAVGCDCI